MPAPIPLLHAANVVARSLIPLFGIALLGWSPGKLLIVYCADTIASLLALMMLVCDRVLGIDAGNGPMWWRRINYGLQLFSSALLPTGIIATVFVIWLVIMLGAQTFSWSEAIADRALWVAVAVQFIGALGMAVQDYKVLQADRNPDLRLKRRFAYLFLRWIIVFMALEIAGLLGPRAAGFVLILAYVAATICFELYPNAVLRAFHAPDLADDGAASDRPPKALGGGTAPPETKRRRAHDFRRG
ncbi:MAG: hypothetical protein M3R31_04800 [Pseudomonadota bacterium]|nr:hypothetical protein [Pseudomonadota bacterium]